MPLIIRREAEAGIASAYDWYEEQRRGLGTEFLEDVSFTIAAIESNPRQFRRVNWIMRRALLRRFPYGVYFLDLDEIGLVATVRHLSRDPLYSDTG